MLEGEVFTAEIPVELRYRRPISRKKVRSVVTLSLKF